MAIFSPWKLTLLNRWLRRSTYSVWRIRGRWSIFRDSRGSNAAEYVYREVESGFYTPQVALKPGDAVLDLGAHVGLFAIPLAKENPEVVFHCFEANPATFRNLQRNLRLNRVRNVVAYNVPVGLEGELVVPQTVAQDNSGASTVVKAAAGVACWDLAHIIQQIGKRPVLVKCDIEGSEYKVFPTKGHLAGIREIMVELHPSPARGSLKAWIEGVVPHSTIALQGEPEAETNHRNGVVVSKRRPDGRYYL